MMFPRAERWAEQAHLPLAVCSVTKALYGYTAPVLDEPRARRQIGRAGITGGAAEVALAILYERAERL